MGTQMEGGGGLDQAGEGAAILAPTTSRDLNSGPVSRAPKGQWAGRILGPGADPPLSAHLAVLTWTLLPTPKWAQAGPPPPS